jgi:hypothetical protein
MIRRMDMVFIDGLMGLFIKETLLTINVMVMEKSNGMMGHFIKVNGIKEK